MSKQLPAEMLDKIIKQACDTFIINSETSTENVIMQNTYRRGYIIGATAYVTELHEANLKYGVLKTAYDNDQNKLELLHSFLKEANERERVLVEALEYCAKPIEHNDANLALFTRQEIARKALAQYEGKKEVGDG